MLPANMVAKLNTSNATDALTVAEVLRRLYTHTSRDPLVKEQITAPAYRSKSA
ncbi:hypothetical protein [Spirosoma aerophilum]